MDPFGNSSAYDVCQFNTFVFQGSFSFTNLKWQVSGKLTPLNVLLQNPYILPVVVCDLKLRQKSDKIKICALEDICVLHR